MLSFAMTACFILLDEIFIEYEFEHIHILRLSLQLISFLVFYVTEPRLKFP